ncbi:hypothetical protein [Pseudoalteromonas rubra]|uniref:Uncharacterized protein n=1 Tax=Pseudoalteromonas rubra TaxID=43658 RepID=A0A5S3X673_9GAMM|nr:hypothetical protein [Pseudoalteromonas rubra]TMP39852.1 hypothetical protein CWB98_00870 [Pseudoalteromonas rubra]
MKLTFKKKQIKNLSNTQATLVLEATPNVAGGRDLNLVTINPTFPSLANDCPSYYPTACETTFIC